MSFEALRPQLFALAYRMVGSAMDAEDIVQEAYVRYEARTLEPTHTGAYLRKVVMHLALDHLKSARVQREEYIGEWLPEPIVLGPTPEGELGKAESISMAFMVVLETLSPLERAVFILREAFDYRYDEIAGILDKTEVTCRQLYSRAKRHIQANRPRFASQPEVHAQLVRRFVQASEAGDLQGFINLLAEQVTVYSDGGGKVPAALHPLRGRERVLQFLAGLAKRAVQQGIQARYDLRYLNGELGMLIWDGAGRLLTAVTFEADGEQIVAIRFVRNPDKLGRLG